MKNFVCVMFMLLTTGVALCDDRGEIILKGDIFAGLGMQNGKLAGSVSLHGTRDSFDYYPTAQNVFDPNKKDVKHTTQTLNLEVYAGQTYLRSKLSSDLYPVSVYGKMILSEKSGEIYSLLIVPSVDVDLLRRNGDDKAFRTGNIFVSADVMAQLYATGSVNEEELGAGVTVSARARAGVGAGEVIESQFSGRAVEAHAGVEVEAILLFGAEQTGFAKRFSNGARGVQFLGKAKYLRAIAYNDLSGTSSDWNSGNKESAEVNYLFVRKGRLWMLGLAGERSRFDVLSADPSVRDESDGRNYYLGAKLGARF